MKRRVLLGVFLILAHVAGAPAQSVRLLKPVDEAAKNPSFLVFRTRLKAIVAKRDAAALLETTHPDIKINFGSGDGVAAFKEMWKPDEPGSELWEELGAVLRLGGTFDGPTTFIAPYTFSRWPEDVEAFDFGAVIGSHVRIRSAPRLNAPILKTVSYAILELAPEAKPVKGWTAVKVDNGVAYIDSRYIRGPVDYRAMFTYAEGRWLMNFFLAGD